LHPPEDGTIDDAANIQKQTVYGELLRQCLTRPARDAVGGAGLLFLVLISYYNASPTTKGWLVGAGVGGMLLTPFIVQFVAFLGVPVSQAIAVMLAVSSIGLIVTALAIDLQTFAIGIVIAGPSVIAIMPMVTAMWRTNVVRAVRGRTWARVSAVGIAFSLTFGLGVSWYLDRFDVQAYRPICVVMAVMVALAAVVTWRMPSQTLKRGPRFPLAPLRFLYLHPRFGYICLTWYFMGFSNLATIPLRMDFIENPVYGFEYSPAFVLILSLIIPQVTAVFANIFWGWLFDHAPFIMVRAAINVTFGVSIFLFFNNSLTLQILGNLLLGVGMGGGNVAWAMWVTKYAPKDHTADYMSVHTFLTGTRGLIGPVIAFWLTDQIFQIQDFTLFCGCLSILSAIMLIPLMRNDDTGRKAQAAANA